MSVWTESAIERLRQMRARGMAYSEMAECFGVSRSAIAGKVSRLGLPFGGGVDGGKARRLEALLTLNASRSHWNAEKDAKLREMVAQGATTRDVEAALGVSRAGAASRAIKLGLVWAKSTNRQSRPRWDPPVPKPKPDLEPRPDLDQQHRAALDRFSAPAPADAIPLIGRPFGRCAWPVGTPDEPWEQLCCGRPVRSDSRFHYCETHYLASFRPKVDRTKHIDKPVPTGTISDRRDEQKPDALNAVL